MPDSRSADHAATMLAEVTEALTALEKEAAATPEKKRGIALLPAAIERLSGVEPSLVKVMGSSAVRAQIAAYERCDREAVVQQQALFREATAANLCLLGAGVLSSLVLARPAALRFLDEATADLAALWLGIAALTLGALAALFSYKARESDRLRRWLTMRGAAEVARLEAFRAIGTAASKGGAETAAAGLALFCRLLLDDQREWLVKRADRHRRSSDRTNRWGGVATALAFVGGSAALIASFQPTQAWMALAGVMGAAVMAYALNREELRRDRANADRYEKAAVALDQLATRLDEVAAEIVADRPEALGLFVDEVTGQLEAEHRQWLDGAAQAEAALARLDSRLKELSQPKP